MQTTLEEIWAAQNIKQSKEEPHFLYLNVMHSAPVRKETFCSKGSKNEIRWSEWRPTTRNKNKEYIYLLSRPDSTENEERPSHLTQHDLGIVNGISGMANGVILLFSTPLNNIFQWLGFVQGHCQYHAGDLNYGELVLSWRSKSKTRNGRPNQR